MATVKLPSIAEAEKNPAVKAVYDDIRATRKSDFINNIWRGLSSSPDLMKRTWEQIKAVMDAHKGEFDAQMQKAGPARKALNDAVMAESFNEATVRQKATDLAAAEADGAVLRAKVFSEVWALLTPEQQTKARELKAQAEQRIGQRRDQFEQRRGQRQGRPKRGQ